MKRKLITLLLACSMVLTLVLLPGAVPAYAADTATGGLLGESFKADGTPIYGTYSRVTNTEELKTYDWPDSGYIFVIATSKYPVSAMNGATVPPGLVLDVYRYQSGTYTFVVRYDTTDGKSLTITDAGTSTAATGVAGFSDVHSTDYYADAVEWATEAGVTNGTGSGKFSPVANVTRADAMTMLWRAAGQPEPASTVSPFTDVSDPGAYYYKAVLWAVEQGITNGIGNRQFGRSDPVAYDQLLTFLCRASGQEAGGSGWSSTAVNWAKENGLTDGLTFEAAASCPRSDVVYFLWNQLADKTSKDSAPVKSDPEGARAAIIKGLLRFDYLIDLNAYNLDVSEAEALAEELTESGEQAIFVTGWHINQNPYLKNASTLSVNYEAGQAELLSQVREKAKEVNAEVITPGMSDYEIAKALHDWLVLNCEYDMRRYSGGMPYTAYTAYGALVDGTAVCAGYAEAYKVLMTLAGIPCELATNTTHGWNIVEIDGEWYHVDVTWDDPTPDKEGYIRYNYFLRSDAFMSKDHARWTAGHTCTSTKYDGATQPSTTEQAELETRKAQQAQLEALTDEIIAFYLDALDGLPYTTAGELQAAETLDYNDAYVTISLPRDQFDGAGLNEIMDTLQDRLKEELSARYPNYELTAVSSSKIYIKRLDVLAEIERRNAILQAETNAHVAEIEEILRETIRNGDIRVRQYKASITGDYTISEISKAVSNITAEGYSFDGYTAKVDYTINSYSIKIVTIGNLRWDKWAEEETQRYMEIIQAAIRSGETEVMLQPGDYPDNSETYFASSAANKMAADGYTFDGLTSGVDFVITGTYISAATRELKVQIAYPQNSGTGS